MQGSRIPLSSCLALVMAAAVARGQDAGYRPAVRVSAPTRIDWVFAVANQSPAEPPADWLPNYKSDSQTYELYVPSGMRSGTTPGLLLFISPSPRNSSVNSFRAVCDRQNLIFASPQGAGNNTEARERVRIVLDVLDDVRRNYRVDPDRTYLSGFSGGGRIACAIAFALPEHFGGVMPICASADLRNEPWLRQRVIDRLSVAHLTGANDFNRGEVERYRGSMLAGVGVRSRVWVAPKLGHAIPSAPLIEEAVRWLDEGLDSRRKLFEKYPATRTAAEPPTRQSQAAQLLAEGQNRLNDPQTKYSGLMLLKGVLERWPDLAAASEAKAILLEHESSAGQAWRQEDVAQQRRFLVAQARGLTDYATGPLSPQYAAQRASMAGAAMQLWERIIQDGQDEAAVAEGRRRLPELEKLASKKK